MKKSVNDKKIREIEDELFNDFVPSILEKAEQIRLKSYHTLKINGDESDRRNLEIFSKRLTNRLKSLWIQNLREWIRENHI